MDDIKRLKPQCHGKVFNKETFKASVEHYGCGSWKNNDLEQQKQWLNEHADLWQK